MFELIIGTNTNRKSIMVSYDKTPKQVLEENSIRIDKGSIHLDGCTLTASDMNTPFKDLIKEATKADLIVVVKADSAC